MRTALPGELETGRRIDDRAPALLDEAHQLEDVVTQYFGVSISLHRVEQLVRDVTQTTGLLRALGSTAETIRQAADDASLAARHLFDTLRLELAGRGAGDRHPLTEELAAAITGVRHGMEEALEALSLVKTAFA